MYSDSSVAFRQDLFISVQWIWEKAACLFTLLQFKSICLLHLMTECVGFYKYREIYLYIDIFRQKAKNDFFFHQSMILTGNRKREFGNKLAKCQIRRYKSQRNRHGNMTEKDCSKKST